MSNTEFGALSPNERLVGNEAQHQLRERYQRFRRVFVGLYLGTLFVTMIGEFVFSQQLDIVSRINFLPLLTFGLLFIPATVYLIYGIVYLFRQSWAPQERYELTIKESKIVNSRDSSHFEVCFEELPYDWYYTYHHNGNWLDHAEMTPGTRVQVTLRKRRGSRYHWYYPELAELNL